MVPQTGGEKLRRTEKQRNNSLWGWTRDSKTGTKPIKSVNGKSLAEKNIPLKFAKNGESPGMEQRWGGEREANQKDIASDTKALPGLG